MFMFKYAIKIEGPSLLSWLRYLLMAFLEMKFRFEHKLDINSKILSTIFKISGSLICSISMTFLLEFLPLVILAFYFLLLSSTLILCAVILIVKKILSKVLFSNNSSEISR